MSGSNRVTHPSLMFPSQFGLYSFLEYEDNYGSNFVRSTVVSQTIRVLTALAV